MHDDKTMTADSCDNIIIIDADFADRVAFDLIVNFERMISRPIPNADMARWIDCLALDGGITPGDNHTQVVLIHSREKTTMEYFNPGRLKEDLHSKAFKDHLGEFSFTSSSEETIASREQLMTDTLRLALSASEVRRVVVVPDEDYYDSIRNIMRKAGDDKRVTVLAMQPMPGGNFRQEILGYSLMSALGIKGDEIPSS